jgi:hypothetical protein
MRNEAGELCGRYVNGYLIVVSVSDLPTNFFCSKKIKALLKPYGFEMESLLYVNAGKKDVPCLYSTAYYKGESFAVESYETLKSMSSCSNGYFTIYLSVENECGIGTCLNASILFEKSEPHPLKFSPLISL